MVAFRTLVTVLCFSISGIQGLDEACSSNSDCTEACAECRDGACQCSPISYSNGSQCLQYATEYQGFCVEDHQCFMFLGANSQCSKRLECVCDRGYVWHGGKCQRYTGKGGHCDSDTICYDNNDIKSLTCSHGKCVCNNIIFYDRGPDCRRRNWPLPLNCVINADCQDDNQVCIKGKCVKKSAKQDASDVSDFMVNTSKGNSQRLMRGLSLASNNDLPSCKIDDDCQGIANSKCDKNTKKCGCLENTYYNNGNCIPGFGACTGTEACVNITNSMCFANSTCICKQGYFLKNGECVAELGVQDPNIKKPEDCKIKPTEIFNNTCYCANYWFPREDKRYCIKTTTQEFQSCMENTWCNVMGPYSYCHKHKCNCSSFAELDEKIFYCNSNSTANVECLRDTDCNINEYCLEETCHCLDGYVKGDDGRCLSDFGTSCSHNSCVGKYLCIDSKCDCHDDYVGVNGDCYKVAENLNETCVYSEQCRNIKFSDCLELSPNDTEKTCSCIYGYTDYENSCLQIKKNGDPCMTTADCTRVINKSFQCRNSVCQCPLDQHLHNGYCRSSASSPQISHLAILISIVSISKGIFS